MNFFLIVICVLCCSSCEIVVATGRKKIASYYLNDTTTPVMTTEPTLEQKFIEKNSFPKKVEPSGSKFSKTHSSNIQAIKKQYHDIGVRLKDLSSDDLEFIKELEKQFMLHGEKLKFRIENDNSTRNSKRDIEADLGYGYSHNGYQYEPPKYVFYPYSQHNVGQKHVNPYPKTEVSIEPSYAYELQPQTYLIPNEQPQIDLPYTSAGQKGENEEPVIVLKIPGPTKYATHLKTLLQSYLEMRAAQYLKILEEAEFRKHNEIQQREQDSLYRYRINHNHNVAENIKQANYDISKDYTSYEEPYQYPLKVMYTPQVDTTVQPLTYPAISDVYQSYKDRQQNNHERFQSTGESQAYYKPTHELQQYYQQGENSRASDSLSHLNNPAFFLISMNSPNAPNENGPIDPVEHYNYATLQEKDEGFLISENNPRSTHTKVIFNKDNPNPNVDYSHDYDLPSRNPYQNVQKKNVEHTTTYRHTDATTSPNVVHITQRPYNYHAHALNSKLEPTKEARNEAQLKNSVESEYRLQQIRDYVREKLGAEMGSSVEIKTKSYQ